MNKTERIFALTYFFVVVLAFHGCHHSTELETVATEIILSTGFESDSIQVSIDNNIQHCARVTTNIYDGYAWFGSAVRLSKGYHNYTVSMVSDSNHWSKVLELSGDLTVIVHYDRVTKSFGYETVSGIIERVGHN